MAENTKIEWAHHTFNPWIGCTKVGPGCDNCYAEADFDKRLHVVKWGAGNHRRLTATSTWSKPLRWNADAARRGVRYRVFCASLADVFDNEVPNMWRMALFSLIAQTPHLDWLLLTKRVGNVMPKCSGDSLMFDMICDRVWLGITVCNQAEADRDIRKLMNVPAKVRFLSMEPLLGPVDLLRACSVDIDSVADPAPATGESFPRGMIDWVVVGGESGPKARPMHPQWARSVRDQCAAAGVPFLFKQWGEWWPNCMLNEDGSRDESTMWMDRVGKKAAGRLLDGVKHDGYPAAPGEAR